MIDKFYFILLILLVSCENNQNQKPLPVEYDKTVEGEIILLGKINRANLEQSEHVEWFKKEYDFYKVRNEWAESVKEHFKGINLKLFRYRSSISGLFSNMVTQSRIKSPKSHEFKILSLS